MVFSHDFSLTLTTLALYQRSLRWFGACSCKPTPGGPPPSLMQLRTLITPSALVAHYLAKISGYHFS